MSFAPITPAIANDATPYAVASAVPSTNADNDLFNQGTGQLLADDPVITGYADMLTAIVELWATGSPTSGAVWVILQGDLGDGQWVDVAWVLVASAASLGTSAAAPSVWLLGTGGFTGCAFNQTRAAGATPVATGINAAPLCSRYRFVGRAQPAGGVNPAVLTTIRYRKQGIR